MSPRRKTPEEEEAILDNIDVVAKNLEEQVTDLRRFISEFRASRDAEPKHQPAKTGG